MNFPERKARLTLAILACACLLQIAMGTVQAWTHLPFCDEGFYGVPAHVLSMTGSLRNPVLESAGIPYLRGIDRHFYWTVPMAMVLQAGVFKVFGFGLLIQRELSVACGLGALLFWYIALRRLVADRVAALAALFLAADYLFSPMSALGRSDMVSLFFGMAAVAGYLHWRERSLPVALVVAHTACGLSGMAHPNGGIAALISVTVLTVYLDRKRLRWSSLGYVAACYGVLGLGWGWYIAKAPDLFWTQFFGNVANRYIGGVTLARLVMGEAARYRSAFGLDDAHGVKLLRYLLPVSYLGSILFCTFSPSLRRQSRVLLLMFLGVSVSLVFLEGSKQSWYLVYLTPLFCAFLALSVHGLWNSGHLLARTVSVVQLAIVLLGVASLAASAAGRHLQKMYQPAVVFLNAHAGPQDLVVASSEFYFKIARRNCLRDDWNLGAVSGRTANYVVLNRDYNDHLADLRERDPVLYRGIEQRLGADYREVFRNGDYQILQILSGRP